MRVATRRQRAAWRVFGDAFDARSDRARTAAGSRRSRRTSAACGISTSSSRPAEAYQGGQPAAEARAFEPLLRGWRVQRDAARRRADQGARLGKVPQVDRRVRRVPPDRGHRRPPGRSRGAAPRPRHDAVARSGPPTRSSAPTSPSCAGPTSTTLHDLRIAAKWLRYTLEFVREALGRDAGPVIEKVVALQDHLGWLHDADVAAGLARAVPAWSTRARCPRRRARRSGGTSSTASASWHGCGGPSGPPWRGVSSLAFRRALGRVVAGL